MDDGPIYLSKKGRIKLERELKKLKTLDRPKIVAEIKRAREMGDLTENAEYHAAKEAQVHLERKIAQLEDKLSRVQSIETGNVPTDKAYLFSKILVKNLEEGEEIEYTLAPPEETDVDNDVISIESPIGSALLGKKVGDKLEIRIPAGILRYEILGISRE
jgi:transcription elongation factor GreA